MKKVFALSICIVALLAVKNINVKDTTAQVGWRATKAVGGGEGAQWAVAGGVGYLGGVGGAWAGAKAGALVGSWGGPWGAAIGGAIGAGVGAY